MKALRRLLVLALAGVTGTLGAVVPAQSASAAAGPVTQIIVWGDSMTHVWPDYLAELVGVPVTRLGVGGDTVQETKLLFDAWVSENPTRVPTTGHLCWCGHVNTNRQNNDAASIVPTLRAMAEQVPSRLFMPIGLTNGPDQPAGSEGYRVVVEGVNVDMARVFRTQYAEVRRYLVTDGLAVAGIEPTSEDLANIAVDVPPRSLRTDGGGNPAHLNEAGRRVTASRLNDLVRGVGWIVDDNGAPTQTAVQSAANPVAKGALVRFTATVTSTSGTPTGQVQFSVYSRLLGAPVTLVNGVAVSVAIRATVVGSHPVVATYSGSAAFDGSAGTVLQVIQPAVASMRPVPADVTL